MDPRAQSRGGSLTPNFSAWPNDAAVCSLWQVLESGSIPREYFLSSTACAGILRRAEKRNKALPEQLREALESVVVTAPTISPSRAAGGTGGQVAQTLDAVLSKGQTMPEKNRFPAVLQPVAFSCKDHGGDAGDVAPTLRAMGHGQSHANAGGQVAIAFHPVQDPISSSDGTTHAVGCGSTHGQASIAVAVALRGREGGATIEVGDDCSFTLRASTGGGDKPHVACITGDVTHALNSANNGNGSSEDGTGRGVPTIAVSLHENQRAEITLNDTAGTIKCAGGKPGQGYPAAMVGMHVRRLTPRECERLQGFPDDWTLIPVKARKKITSDRFAYLRASYPGLTAENALLLARDGPRYKAIGNSWAVTCARWVGRRIQLFLDGDL
jgi:hypothetical protein